MINSRSWFGLALIYFSVAAFIGVLLRSFAFTDYMPFIYRNLIHAHSHVAMLGWVFNVLLLGITREFLPVSWTRSGSFKVLFWGIQLSVFGMLVAFSLQGYAVWSISFSTVHVILSYILIVRVVIALNLWRRGKPMSERLLTAALIFLGLSSFGPWGLAILSANGFSGTPIYKSAIYWFLHFTYNGWMTIALLAIWVKSFVDSECLVISQKMRIGFTLLMVSIPASFLLSLYEFNLHYFWHYAGMGFGFIQLLGLWFMVSDYFKRPVTFKWPFVGKVFKFSLIILLLKSLLQTVSALPVIQSLAFFNRDAIILYMHLVFIGWISSSCLAYGLRIIDFKQILIIRAALIVVGLGFAVQELELAIRIIGFDNIHPTTHSLVLFTASAIMFLGLMVLLVKVVRERKALES